MVDKLEDCMASCNELNCFAFYHVKMEGDKQDQCMFAFNAKNNWKFKEKHLVRFGDVPGAVAFPKEAIEGRTYLRVNHSGELDKKDAVQKQLY